MSDMDQVHETSSDEVDDDGRPYGSQDIRDVFSNIRDSYRYLGKVNFRNELMSAYSESNLSEFRQALYDYAIIHVSNTPVATLVVRLDTQNRGGNAIDHKLAEDIFTLFHYIQGDSSSDITKLFQSKDKARIKDSSKASDTSVTDTQDTSSMHS